ncbi:MAG: hypothetical protein IJ127_18890, partial [Afipia sp.]|nr:hypothetical protein [Afipia sp.]
RPPTQWTIGEASASASACCCPTIFLRAEAISSADFTCSLRALASMPEDAGADSDEVARVYRYEVARGFRDDVAHLSDLISPGGEAF